MPQDKVQDFSKMDSQALLENTERSVGDPNILLHHQRLKELRSEFKELETCIAHKKRLLESNTQKRDGLQQTVSTIKERKLIKTKIVTLKQKKAWMLYDQTRRRLVEVHKRLILYIIKYFYYSFITVQKNSYFFVIKIFFLQQSKKCRDAAAKKLQATEAKLKPLKEKIDKIKSNMTQLKNTLNNHVSITQKLKLLLERLII